MIFKQTIINHIIILRFTWITTLIFALGWIYFDFDMDYLIVIGIYQLLFTIPALYLHIEYTIKNAGDVFEILPNSIKILAGQNNQEYNFSEINKIVVYKSASLDRMGIPFSQMEYYYFVRIFTKSEKEIVITNLMGKNIDRFLINMSGIPQIRKRSFFCTIHWK